MFIGAVLSCGTIQPVDAVEHGPIFNRNSLSRDIVLEGDLFHLPTVFGPTGLTGWMLDGTLVVREVAKGSPADGHMLAADLILGVAGQQFQEDPLRALGEAIIVAERSGRLELTILRAGKEQSVVLPIRKMPRQAEEWPLNCNKSNRILGDAADFLAKRQHPDGSFDTRTRVIYGTIGLAWLATDDPAYLENCRRLIHWYEDTEQINDPDNANWGWGYFGAFLGEYYLKTGDPSVLKLCEAISERIAGSQYRCGGWGHAPVAPGAMEGYRYVSGGLMNPAGVACWLALELFNECGIEQERALSKARNYFMRFVDNGNIPYGDHHPEFNTTGNSKDALACLALAVKGDTGSAELIGRLCTDFYKVRHHGHTGGFLGLMWGNVAGSHNPHRPDYQRMLDHWDPILHVSRRWDGGFLMPQSITGWQYLREGPLFNTSGLALTYATPRMGLLMLGAPWSVFGRREPPADVRRGLKLYEALADDELLKTVNATTSAGKQLHKASTMRKLDIKLSLEKARRALKKGNPVLARSIARNLDAMCGGKLPECHDILRKAESRRTILDASKEYDKHRWLIYSNPESRLAIEELSRRRDVGIYAGLARDCLAVSPEDSRWQHSAALLFARYFGRKDALSISGTQRLGSMKGTGWLRTLPLDWLRTNGHSDDAFLRDWTPLVPASGAPNTNMPAPLWRCVVEPPATNWMQLDFDDRDWEKATAPLSGTSFQFIRIPFEASGAQIDSCRLYLKNDGRHARAAVYLNGICVTWVDPWRDEYLNITLAPSARRHLKKGRNILGVRLENSRKFDIGLYSDEGGRSGTHGDERNSRK
jgi:hypothetical protein